MTYHPLDCELGADSWTARLCAGGDETQTRSASLADALMPGTTVDASASLVLDDERSFLLVTEAGTACTTPACKRGPADYSLEAVAHRTMTCDGSLLKGAGPLSAL